MSEVVQGALIGISGAIIGAIITTVITYINNKSQLEFQLFELKTARKIKAREEVLIPLRKAINTWSEYSNKEMIVMVQMGEASKKTNKAELKKAIELWLDISKKRDEARFNMKVLVGQLSDKSLIDLIREVEVTQTEANEKTIELTVMAYQPESMNFEVMKRLSDESFKCYDNILIKLVPANKRIEELLCGE